MILSMTGFGKAEGELNKKRYYVELRSVNNRFNEITFKYPKFLSSKDFEMKDAIRKKISRGKITAVINVEAADEQKELLQINEEAIKYYTKVLKSLKKIIGSTEKIKLEHILKFNDLLTVEESAEVDEKEFKFILRLIDDAVENLIVMKRKEGDFLKDDMVSRINFISSESDVISEASARNITLEKEKLREKVKSLLNDEDLIEEKRLELELIMLAEKLDVTEECIRLKSHLSYFLNHMNSEELAGRRLNFLMQEINREVNTIGSKSLDSGISQKVAVLKEEVEKIREQLQNVE